MLPIKAEERRNVVLVLILLALSRLNFDYKIHSLKPKLFLS